MATKSRFADRGLAAEKAVQKYLEWWQSLSVYREYNRLPDTKAAGRIIKAAPADFEFFATSGGGMDECKAFGLIEVKETKHEFRLARDKITQLPRMRKRAKCGGTCPVLILHSELDLWRIVLAPDLMEFGDQGSWDLRNFRTFTTPGAALNSLRPFVFEMEAR